MEQMRKLRDYFVAYETAKELFCKVQKLAYLGCFTLP